MGRGETETLDGARGVITAAERRAHGIGSAGHAMTIGAPGPWAPLARPRGGVAA